MNKWHDLRKNPKDLPKEDGRYLCESKSALCPEASFMEVSNFSNDLHAVDEFDFCKYKKTKKKELEPKLADKPYEEMTIEELQAGILAKMAKNGPITDQMRKDVEENVYKNSLLNWIKSFNN